MKDSAIILTSGMFNSRNAKTAFGLIRHSEKYRILAVIDQNFAGQDAGEIVTGKNLNSMTDTMLNANFSLSIDYLRSLEPVTISFITRDASLSLSLD